MDSPRGSRTGLTREQLRRELIRRGLIEKTPIINAIGASAGDALSFGFGDELQGELAAAGYSGDEARRRRQEATAAARRRLDEARTDRPVTTFVTGAATMAIPGTAAFRGARLLTGAGRLGRELSAARGAGNLVRSAQLARPALDAGRRALYGSSALQGAVYGAGSGNDGNRVLGAGAGALAGMGGVWAGEALGAGATLLTRRGMRDPVVRAERLVARRLAESRPTEQDLIRRLRGEGLPLSAARSRARTLIETDKAGQFTPADMINRTRAAHSRANSPLMVSMIPQAARDARAINAVGGPGANLIDDTLTAQREAFSGDVARTAEKAFRPRGPQLATGALGRRVRGGGGLDEQPPPSGLQEFTERLTSASRAENAAAYDRAYRSTQFGMRPEHAQAAARRMSGSAFKDRARLAAIDRADEDIVRLSDDLDNALAAAGLTPDEAAGWLQRMSSAYGRDGAAVLDDFTARADSRLSREQIAAVRRKAWELQDTVRARTALDMLADRADPNLLNARALDLYQRGLRHLADEAGGPATEGGRNIAAVRSTFMQNIRSIAPELADAVGQARQFHGLREANELGQAIFKPGREGEIDRWLRQPMHVEEQDAFMVGALDALEQRLGANDLSFVRQLQRNENWRAMVMRTARSKQAGRRLLDLIDDKVEQADRANFIRGGSQTTPIAQDVRRLTEGESELGFIQDVINSGGDIKSPALRAAAGVYERFARPGIRDPRVQLEMSRMLMQPGTITNAERMAARLQAAPKSPVLTPEGQLMAQQGGVLGSAAGQQAAGQNIDAAARFTGAQDFADAGASFTRGDLPAAAGSLALGGLAVLPATHEIGPLAKAALAGLGIGALGVGSAQASEGEAASRRELTAAQERVRNLETELDFFSNVDPNDPAAVREVQQRLLLAGIPGVRIDGVARGQTAAAIQQRKTAIMAELAPAREALDTLQLNELTQRTSPGSLEQGFRTLAPYAGSLAGGLVGHFGVPFTRGWLGRSGAVRHEASRLAARNKIADRILDQAGQPLAPRTRAGRVPDETSARFAAINDFWQAGGARGRVPFRSTKTGWVERAGSRASRSPPRLPRLGAQQARPTGQVEPGELFPHQAERLRLNDILAMGGGATESAIAHGWLQQAKQDVEEARANVERDPHNELYRKQLRELETLVATLETVENAGRGYVGGRLFGLTHTYPRSQPNIRRAEEELSALRQYLRPKRKR